ARAADQPQSESLFDGKSLEGWVQKNGTATYRVEDETIVGVTNEGSPNSFLCTKQDYGDFELEFEVKVHDRLNSGVQIRSQTKDVPTGRVNGPQVEIESSPGEEGYIYGEATGRGWLIPEDELKPHSHFKNGEWNKYRVVANGRHIQTWINGEPIADLTLDEEFHRMYAKGFIGLQVHSIGAGQGPYEVAWRNLRLRKLEGE
ncbi:MAG: DUF1080 domain-containing protein, partial [Planctomycetes bacterium]|nr:DUF1080 domain-containing protein [Planctomycetota bacterium]